MSLQESIIDLPYELIEEITGYLSYPDTNSLGLTCQSMTFLLSEGYWSYRLTRDFPNYREESSWLTSKGKYVQATTLKGDLIPGSENFLSLLELIPEAYRQGKDKLLVYFTHLTFHAKYLYPLVSLPKKSYSPYLRLQEVLKMCIIDSREDTFLLVWEAMDPSGGGKEALRDPKIIVPLYLLAKRKRLWRIREVLVAYFPNLWGTFGSYVDYCLQSMDLEMFRDIAPYIDYYDKKKIKTTLEIYPWPEGEAIYETIGQSNPGFVPIPNLAKVNGDLLTPGFSVFYSPIKGFTRLLISGERQKIREELLRIDKDGQIVKNIQENINCSNLTTRKLYDLMFRSTIPSLIKIGRSPIYLQEIQTQRVTMGTRLAILL